MDKSELINRLKAAFISSPYDRFGQFLYNSLCDKDDCERIYYLLDEELIKEIEEHQKKFTG